jgi:hypothetical protein
VRVSLVLSLQTAAFNRLNKDITAVFASGFLSPISLPYRGFVG